MSTLPSGWIKTQLGEVADWGSGGTPKADTADYYGGSIPWAVIGDLNDGSVVTTARAITDSGLSNSSAKMVDDHVVLVAMYGSIGKLGLPTFPMATNQAIAFARPRRGVIDRLYLFYYLMHARDALTTAGKGATQQNISQTVLKAWPIPLAPFAEQERIVAAIEEQFSRLDAGVAALERIRKNLKRMRASVLEAAVGGSLVACERDPSASLSLIEELRAERAERSTRKTVELAPDVNVEAPDAWLVVPLGDLAESITYGTSVKTQAGIDGVPVLRMGNLGWGTIAYDDLKYLHHDQVDPRLLLEPGDLLFNRTNSAELVGKAAVFDHYPEPITFASYLIRVRPLPSARMGWVSLVMNSSVGRRYVASVRNQQVGQANVNGTKLAATPVPIPSLAEQELILSEAERLISIINALEGALDVARTRATGLRASVLADAFSGKLVPQKLNDESATVLLDRIASQRASSNGHRRVRTPQPMNPNPGPGDAELYERRMGIQLMWEDSYSKAEIAETMEISPAQVTSEITRMRRQGWDLPKRRRKATA